MSQEKIANIQQKLTPLIKKLEVHPIYKQIISVDDVITFMSTHIYCVWDFMNLLTTLQQKLSCVTVPWQPVSSVQTARFIHELVLEEASDEINGEVTSHFAFYVKALNVLCPTGHPSDLFLKNLAENQPYQSLIQAAYLPPGVSAFLTFTRQCIENSILDVAAAFTFGREVVIPSLFTPLVSQLAPEQKGELQFFMTYLERHIELDGGHHRHLATQMVSQLCHSDDDWQRVENVALAALEARLALWNTLSEQLSPL